MKQYTVILVLPASTTKEIALAALKELQACPLIKACQISCEGLEVTPTPGVTYDFVINETASGTGIDLPVIPIEIIKYMRPEVTSAAIENIIAAYKKIGNAEGAIEVEKDFAAAVNEYLNTQAEGNTKEMFEGLKQGVNRTPQVGVNFFSSVSEGIGVTQGKEQLNDVKLHPVVLQKTDTCWTYALKRIGCVPVIQNSKNVLPHIHLVHRSKQYGNVIKPKDLLPIDHELIEQHFILCNMLPDGIPEIATIYAVLQPGDLIMLSGNEIRYILPDRINENGELEYTSQIIRRHVVVYEGNGMVSHAVLDHLDAMFKSVTAMCIKIESLEAVLQGSAGRKAYLLRLK